MQKKRKNQNIYYKKQGRRLNLIFWARVPSNISFKTFQKEFNSYHVLLKHDTTATHLYLTPITPTYSLLNKVYLYLPLATHNKAL